jgi:hypothetical protein
MNITKIETIWFEALLQEEDQKLSLNSRQVVPTMRTFKRVAQGIPPQHVLNTEVLTRPGFRAKLARFAEDGITTTDRGGNR